MISLTSIAAMITALGIISGVGYQGYVLKQEIRDNTQYRLLQTYKILQARRRQRQLTIEEYISFCNAGRQLRIFVVCPPRKRR